MQLSDKEKTMILKALMCYQLEWRKSHEIKVGYTEEEVYQLEQKLQEAWK